MEIPCILDPNRACPETCPLHPKAKSVIEKLAVASNKPVESVIAILRTPGPEKLDFRATSADSLREAKLIEWCKHYPEAEYRPGRDS